jgi:hypothetical protein
VPSTALEANGSWASTISASADRLPDLFDVLARLALLARRLGHRRAQIVDTSAADQSTVVLGAVADLLAEAAAIELQVVSPGGATGGGHLGPIGCVVVDFNDPVGVGECFDILAAPASRLLPEVLVARRAGSPCSPADPAVVAAFVAAFKRRHPGRLLRREATRSPSTRTRGVAPPAEPLFVLDVADHAHRGVLTATLRA